MSTNKIMQIPNHEIRATFARSSGAGGQNVNKTSTKVALYWPIGGSRILNWEEKERIRAKLANRINNNDELVVYSEEERSQSQNRAKALRRLRHLVAQALRVPKKRRQTKPTKISIQRRLEEKKRRSKLKKSRNFFEF